MSLVLKNPPPSPYDLRTAIHDRVGRAYWYDVPVANFDYNSFFAATDTLLDVSDPLLTAQRSEWPADDSEAKIWLYGILQALAVQQEACIQLLKCFSLPPDPDAQRHFNAVNDSRIRIAGHPHNHRRWKGLTAKGVTFLSHRAGPATFSIGTYPDAGAYKAEEVDVIRLLGIQDEAIQTNLAVIWNFIVDDPRFDPKLLQEVES